MLIAASGNTAMQSLMPSIGRELRIPDLWMAGRSACRPWPGSWQHPIGRSWPTIAGAAR
jgi:hypothetical protein